MYVERKIVSLHRNHFFPVESNKALCVCCWATCHCQQYKILRVAQHCFSLGKFMSLETVKIHIFSSTLLDAALKQKKKNCLLMAFFTHAVLLSRSLWQINLCAFSLSLSLFFWVALRPNSGHGLLIHEVSRSHTNDAPHSVGLLWTSDQLVAETSIWQHTTLATDKHPCPRWDSNTRSQQASGGKPRP